MANKPLPTPDVLRQLLRYEPDTGKLFWKERGPEWFSDDRLRKAEAVQRRWNSRHASKEAFTASAGGYMVGTVLSVRMLAHRAAWAIFYGDWPADGIDHINGEPSDNRIQNLRSVSQSENMKNRGIPSNNTSGVIGVRWDAPTRKWRASISIPGNKNKYIGIFESIEDAKEARKLAEAKYGYHQNHGGRDV